MTRLIKPLFAFLLALLIINLATAAPGNPVPENVGLSGTASFPGYASYSLTTSNTQILDRETSRNLLVIHNSGATNNAVIKPGSAPLSANDGIILTPGASFSPTPAMVDLFYARSASSTTTLTVIQGSK